MKGANYIMKPEPSFYQSIFTFDNESDFYGDKGKGKRDMKPEKDNSGVSSLKEYLKNASEKVPNPIKKTKKTNQNGEEVVTIELDKEALSEGKKLAKQKLASLKQAAFSKESFFDNRPNSFGVDINITKTSDNIEDMKEKFMKHLDEFVYGTTGSSLRWDPETYWVREFGFHSSSDKEESAEEGNEEVDTETAILFTHSKVKGEPGVLTNVKKVGFSNAFDMMVRNEIPFTVINSSQISDIDMIVKRAKQTFKDISGKKIPKSDDFFVLVLPSSNS